MVAISNSSVLLPETFKIFSSEITSPNNLVIGTNNVCKVINNSCLFLGYINQKSDTGFCFHLKLLALQNIYILSFYLTLNKTTLIFAGI